MRISRPDLMPVAGGVRVSAEIIWEEARRPPQRLHFDVPEPFAQDVCAEPNAFVVACLPFAMWLGESRIQIDGALCPLLRDGLEAAMTVWSGWYRRCRPVAIEPAQGWHAAPHASAARTASFLSGGVDGLSTLRSNRLDYPRGHPASISDALLLFGSNDFQYTAEGPVPHRLVAFEAQRARLEALGRAEGFSLIPIRANVRLLSPDYGCWTAIGFGAATIAAAHLFGSRFNRVLFASDGDGIDPSPGASHPRVDHHLSSTTVQVMHDQSLWTRSDKLALLTEWPDAMSLMQPCHYVEVPPHGQINCGTCEKCVRTRLGLMGLGKLGHGAAFGARTVTVEEVAAIPITNRRKAALLAALLPDLRRQGHVDLARAVHRKLRRSRWEWVRNAVLQRVRSL